jgi:ATP phosphoribosyltransferase-like protein
MVSSTRLYAHKGSLADANKKRSIEAFVLSLRAVLNARQRVMVEVNVSAADLERLAKVMPCMREPTIQPLHGDTGYAVKAAVPRRDLPDLIPRIKAAGGTDIVVVSLAQIIP